MKKESILKRLNTEVVKIFDKKILPECGSINKFFLIKIIPHEVWRLFLQNPKGLTLQSESGKP
jgi:hypothetical protein